MVIFVGDQPSKLNKSQDVPFVGARCYPVLMKWIQNLEITEYSLFNSHKLEFLKKIQRSYDNGAKIVALGNAASARLGALEIDHFKLPHPSPLNRSLNDVNFIALELKKCNNWLRS